MYILVRVCIWVLGLYKLEALGVLIMGFLELCSPVCAKLLCFCLFLFDRIVELHNMNENDFFPHGKKK